MRQAPRCLLLLKWPARACGVLNRWPHNVHWIGSKWSVYMFSGLIISWITRTLPSRFVLGNLCNFDPYWNNVACLDCLLQFEPRDDLDRFDFLELSDLFDFFEVRLALDDRLAADSSEACLDSNFMADELRVYCTYSTYFVINLNLYNLRRVVSGPLTYTYVHTLALLNKYLQYCIRTTYILAFPFVLECQVSLAKNKRCVTYCVWAKSTYTA